MALKPIYQENYDGFTDKVKVSTGFSSFDAPEIPPNPNDGDFVIGGNIIVGGAIGIGTTSPITNFDVLGTSYISESLGIGTTNSGTCGKLEVIGTICATNFNSTSDIKFKTDIEPIKNPLSLISEMNGVHFRWIDSPNYCYGLIAQDLEKITPELVANGNYKTVNYSGIIPILIESIKDLNQQVSELQNEVNRLKSCILHR